MANRKRIAEGLYRQETRSGPSFLAKFSYRGKEYSVQIKDEETGEPVRDERVASDLWDEGRARLRKGQYPFEESRTVDEWLKEYLAFWKPPRNAQSTHDDKTFRLTYWRKWLRENHPGASLITDLRREHFEEYQMRKVKPRTVNLDFRYLRHALNWAVDREWLERSPIDRLKRLPEAVEPKKTLSVDTVGLVAKHLDLVARAAWLFCADTGCRPGEMFALQWADLDIQERAATIRQSKTNKLKNVWYSAATKKLLEAIPPKGKTVFYNTKGKPFNRLSWRDTVYRAADAAKLMKWGDDTRKGGKRIIWGTPPNPYALRHTATSAMLETEDIATVRDAVGHSSIAVTNIYAHSSPERIKAAFERLHKRKK